MADEAPRYREIRRLGAGGMATVVLAEDAVLGRPVALKRVYGSGDPRERMRLKREALVGASLNHPNLVFVYDVHTEQSGDLMIVMEYVDGRSLSQLVAGGGSLPPQEALRILHEVASALDAIHAKGIVHRDVKPANVLLGRDGAVKLADLGVAGATDRTRSTSGEAVVGSFSYMPLEQLEGARPSPGMDVYALAAVAHELLSGKKARPERNPLALAHAISTQPAPDLRSAWPGAPAAAAAVLKRGMSRDPRERPASASELVNRLRRGLEPQPETGALPAVALADQPPAVTRGEAGPAAASSAGATAEPQHERSSPRPLASAKLLVTVAALALLVVGAAVAAALSSSHGKRSATAGSTLASHSGRSAAPAGSTPSSVVRGSAGNVGSATSAGQNGGSSAGGQGGGTVGAAATQSGTPSGAVEAFYEEAAAHQYPQAWALADASMRSEVGGLESFQAEMSTVRSIEFHRAQVVGGQSPGSATVAVQTTSVQSDQTQQCAGTANTVRSGGAWLLDHISISCY